MDNNSKAISDTAVYAMIEQEFNDFVDEIKKRNQSNLVGVKIPQLTEAIQINDNDYILVDQGDGTKRASMKSIMDAAGVSPEVVEARHGVTGTRHTKLKERLDEMETKTNTSIERLDNIQPRFIEVEKEVQTARGLANNGLPHANLNSRLDELKQDIIALTGGSTTILGEIDLLKKSIERNITNIETNKNDINTLSQKVDGFDNRLQTVEGFDVDIKALETKIGSVETKANKNESDITDVKNVLTKTLRFQIV